MQYRSEDGYTAELIDDGTMDTVVRVTMPDGRRRTMRYSQERAAECRDPETGAMTEDGFKELAEDAIEDVIEDDDA